MKRFPLHIQILVALILGTVFGSAINPGEIRPQSDGTCRFAPQADGGWQMVESTQDGQQVFRDQFVDSEALITRFPGYRERLDNGAPFEISVTERSAHLVDDGSSITINYSRKLDGRMVMTQLSASSSDELKKQSSFWADEHAKRSESAAQTIIVSSRMVGDLFLRLLKMITIPLIFTSLVTGVSGLGDPAKFGSMFSRTILYYVTTSVLAITTGLIIVNLVQPGVGAELPGGGSPLHGEGDSLGGVFLGMLHNLTPTNPINALANGQFLSIISFSILIGIFIIYTGGESARVMRQFFQAAFDVMMRMTMAIIALAPIGVFAFITFATATQGLDVFRTLAWYMLAVFLALLVHATVVLPLLVRFVGRRNPLEFARAMSPALMTAFSTASSNATLPLTLTSVEERAGVSNRVSSFVLPLGATINMDGTALYEAVAVMFIAQASGLEMTIGTQIIIAITALMASVGAAGIPHAGLVMMAIVLQAVGLPLEAQGIIIAVDRVLDMCRTSVNVWSDSCGCAILNRFEGDTAVSATAE